MYKKYPLSILLFLALYLTQLNYSHADEEFSIPVANNVEINIEKFSASGKYLIVWLAPEYGLRNAHRSLAKLLAQNGIEVWLGNILESLFLTQSSNAIKKLDANYAADIIEIAYQKTGKKIIVASDSYGTLSALEGAHRWQQRKHPIPYVIGALLFNPYTYASIPPLGQLPEYMPIISATNIPIMIYQTKNSGNIAQFDTLVEKLQQHGNPVFTRIMPKVMSLFYENDVTDEMRQKVKPLAKNIQKIIPLLAKYPIPKDVVALKTLKKHKSGIDIYLKDFKANLKPLAINLKDAFGNDVVKNDYKGQVTIINFWATWCPPCVEEIPSLNRLKKKTADLPVELISINYAEDKKTITDFMKKVDVDFPVLLDKNGDFAKKWNVITYPSTFVIDKQGNIKYGVNAAIEWDSPEFIEKIKSLL